MELEKYTLILLDRNDNEIARANMGSMLYNYFLELAWKRNRNTFKSLDKLAEYKLVTRENSEELTSVLIHEMPIYICKAGIFSDKEWARHQLREYNYKG